MEKLVDITPVDRKRFCGRSGVNRCELMRRDGSCNKDSRLPTQDAVLVLGVCRDAMVKSVSGIMTREGFTPVNPL